MSKSLKVLLPLYREVEVEGRVILPRGTFPGISWILKKVLEDERTSVGGEEKRKPKISSLQQFVFS